MIRRQDPFFATWRIDMCGDISEPEQQFSGCSQMIFENILIAEYLMSQGYLVSELRELSPATTTRLILESKRYAAVQLAKIETRDKIQQKYRLSVCLN